MAYSLLSVKNLEVLDSFNSFDRSCNQFSAQALNWMIQGNGWGSLGWKRLGNRGRMMEAEIGRGRLPGSKVSLYKDQSVLILNQNSAPCAADKCDSLLPLLQKSLPVKCIQEQNANRAAR